MSWLLVLAAVILLPAALLALPLQIGFCAAFKGPGDRLRTRATIRWGFGLVDRPLTRGPVRQSQKRPAVPKRRPKRRRSRFRLRPLLMNSMVRRRVKALFRELARAIQWRVLRLEARFGLDDPADTGRLWGLVGPLLANHIPSHSQIAVQPAFEGETLTFDGEGELRVIPLQIVWLLLSFMVSPVIWRVVWPMLRRR